MSEITHSFRENPPRPPAAGRETRTWAGALTLALTLGGLVTLLIGGMVHSGPRLLSELASRDPITGRRQAGDSLWVTRSLLTTGHGAGEVLWLGRQSGGAAGFYLAGAVLTEQRGAADASRLWLALDALERNDPEHARKWLEGITPAGPLPDPQRLHEPGWLDRSPWGSRLRQSLQP